MCMKYLVEFLEHNKFPIMAGAAVNPHYCPRHYYSLPHYWGRLFSAPRLLVSTPSTLPRPCLCSPTVQHSSCCFDERPELQTTPFPCCLPNGCLQFKCWKGIPNLTRPIWNSLFPPSSVPIWCRGGGQEATRGHKGVHKQDPLNLSAFSSWPHKVRWEGQRLPPIDFTFAEYCWSPWQASPWSCSCRVCAGW